MRRLRGLEARYRHAERGLLGEIQALERSVAVLDRELELARTKIRQGEADVRALEVEEAALLDRCESERLALRRAVRSAHARRGPDVLQALLARGSPSELPRSLRLLSFLGERQTASLARFEETSRELTDTRQTLEQRNRDVLRERAGIEPRRAALARARAAKEALLGDVERRTGEAVSELREAAGSLRALVTDLGQAPAAASSSGFEAARGLLPWPAEAPVVKRFGVEVHPRFHTLVENPGIELGALLGTPVHAVHAGQVAFADWFQGYGQLIVVDHGDHYYSLYAHLSTIGVQRGARVSAGTLIGRSGETGSLTGPSLYFEIRKGEVAVDPAHWLRRQ